MSHPSRSVKHKCVDQDLKETCAKLGFTLNLLDRTLTTEKLGRRGWEPRVGGNYLELLRVQPTVEDPPVLDPLLALVDGHAAGEEAGERRELELPLEET